MANPYTIQNTDIQTALGVSRTTLWRIFKGSKMAHARVAGRKHFIVADVISRLRQRPNHIPKTEITLLTIDKQRRQRREHEAQKNDI